MVQKGPKLRNRLKMARSSLFVFINAVSNSSKWDLRWTALDTHTHPPPQYIHRWKAMDHGFLLTLSIHLAEIPTSPQNTLGLK